MNRSFVVHSTALSRQARHDPAAFRRRAYKLVFCVALLSRLLTIVVGIVSVYYAGQYDSSSKVMGVSYTSLQCFVNWDGARFADIARYGYVYEESHAFFPLMPLAMRATQRYVLFWVPMVNEIDLVALSGGVVSTVCFIASALVMHELSTRVLGDARLALRSTVLYCFNPASIFFSVAYSESLFALLSFTGMLLLSPASYNDKQDALLVHDSDDDSSDSDDEDDAQFLSFRKRFVASSMFALATATRSNGVLLCAFTLYAAAQTFHAAPSTIVALLDLVLIAAPHAASLFAVLGFAYYKFCNDDSVVPDWCSARGGNIYTHVQAEYWDLGFARYYRLDQLPNFALAAPIFLVGFTASLQFSSLFEVDDPDYYKHHREFFSGSRLEVKLRRHILRTHAAHLFCHLAVAASVMHIQVATRFVCAACPCIYWYCAVMTKARGTESFIVLVYFLVFYVMGSALFCGYLPWT